MANGQIAQSLWVFLNTKIVDTGLLLLFALGNDVFLLTKTISAERRRIVSFPGV